MTSLRIGILGAARIAPAAVIKPAANSDEAQIVAVAARDRDRAESYAAKHNIPKVHDSYAALIADPAIDAIYNPLPNGLHAEWTIAALEAGKPVLCEKPLCVTPEETRRVLATADTASVPLWEAFVFPFHEQIELVRHAVARGRIGEVREIVSRFHFVLDDPNDIRLSAELGGGSLFDVGCYPTRLARLLFDAEPDLDRTLADAVWTPSGVDTELWGA